MQIPVAHKSRAKRITVRVVRSPGGLPKTIALITDALRKKTLPAVQSRLQNVRIWLQHVTSPAWKLRRAAFYSGIFLGFTFGYLGLTNGIAYAHQTVRAEHVVNHAINEPIRIVFNRPVKSGLQYSWQETVDGSWRFEKQLGGVKALIFTPKTILAPNSVLHLRLKKVQPTADIMSKTPSEQTIRVVTERAPRVIEQTPTKKAELVRPNSEVSLRLSAPNKGLRKLVLSGDIPVVSQRPSSRDDVVFRWKLSSALEQGRAYRAEVMDMLQSGEKQIVAVFDFTTVAEPQVTSTVTGYIHPNQTITLSFDQDMAVTENTVQFAMPGKGSWQSKRQYSFTTSLVVPGKTYSYKVAKGTASVPGGVMTNEKVFYAQTPGNVMVVSAQPSGARVSLATALSLTFDQQVDRSSAENAFYMQPKVEGSFSWSGNTMTYRVSGLNEQTTYSYGVSSGIKPVFGMVGTAYNKQFTTVPPVRKLAVPYYHQAYALSCEAASLRMALGYYGIGASDMEILGKIGYAPQPRDTATNTWQDPNVEFVGDVNGKLNVTGWGVYAGPVAKAARSFGRSADVIYSPSVSSVASAIHAGRPVVVWGVMGWSAVDDSWNTATSGVVHAAKNQHVRTVYGVEGTAENPIGFFLHDPIRGSVYLSAEALQASMNGGGRQILVVY